MRTRHFLVAAACATLLTGCGGAAAPGVAASVGDETISTERIDATTTAYCSAQEENYTANGVALPLGTVRRQVLSSLVMREIADQIAERYDVGTGEGYAQARQQVRGQVEGLSEAEREAVLEVETVGGYLRDVVTAAAEKDLADQGVDAGEEQVLERAIDLFAHWSDEAPVELNPRYGVRFSEGDFVPAGSDLSVPVSEDARSAQVVEDFEQSTDQAEQMELGQRVTGYARSLPESQRCGG